MLFLRHRRLRCHSLLLIHRKFLSTTSSQPLHLLLSFATYMIWGSNTSLGETLISTGLASSSSLPSSATNPANSFNSNQSKPVSLPIPIPIPISSFLNSPPSLHTAPLLSLFASNPVLSSSSLLLFPSCATNLRPRVRI